MSTHREDRPIGRVGEQIDHACVAGPQNKAELLQPTTEAQVRNAYSLLSDTVLLVFVTWH